MEGRKSQLRKEKKNKEGSLTDSGRVSEILLCYLTKDVGGRSLRGKGKGKIGAEPERPVLHGMPAELRENYLNSQCMFGLGIAHNDTVI